MKFFALFLLFSLETVNGFVVSNAPSASTTRLYEEAVAANEGTSTLGAAALSARTEGTKTIFTSEQIDAILPHRYPFALVDKVIEYEEGKSAVGVKCVTKVS